MEFLYTINNVPVSDERWSLAANIFDAYMTACGGYDPKTAAARGGKAVTWMGSGKDEVGLVKGADAFAGGQFTNMGRSFRSAGDNYGVSEQP